MKFFIIFAIAFTFATSAQAKEGLNPWLHCGIGAMVFPKPEHEVAAAISNIIWDLGTTAVSSNASSQDSCNGSPNVASAKFITETYANLEEELFMGKGQYTATLLNIKGCSEDSHNEIYKSLKASHTNRVKSDAYKANSALEKSQNLYNDLNGIIESQYSNSCTPTA